MRGWFPLAAASVVAGACRPTPPAPPATAAQVTPAPPREQALRTALLARVRADQAVRQRMINALQAGRQPDPRLAAEVLAVDTANAAWLKGVVAARGWPGRTLVGADRAAAAFLLVQHADQDTAFQARALSLLERAYPAGEVTGQQVALLTDRVAKARGQPQVYGTQASNRRGRMVLDPIADSARVDVRRARMGLMPLAEYVRLLDSVYTARPTP